MPLIAQLNTHAVKYSLLVTQMRLDCKLQRVAHCERQQHQPSPDMYDKHLHQSLIQALTVCRDGQTPRL